MAEGTIQRYEGTNYMLSGFYQDIAELLETLKGLSMREDDIICSGFPRSGNHWAMEVSSMILRQETTLGDTAFLTSMFEMLGDGIEEKIKPMKSPRYFATHFRFNYFPKEVIDKGVKIIYLLRNPKDALVSFYRLSSEFSDPRMNFTGTWDEFLDLQLRGEFRYGSWFDHVLSAERFMEDNPDHPLYVHCFEEMKLNPVNSVKNMCAFLGTSDDLAEKIAEVTKFKNMKEALLAKKYKDQEKHGKPFARNVARDGEIGGWREYFTAAQNLHFDRVFKEKMADSRLAALISQYMYQKY